MSLSHADYLNIMKFYKIDVSNISKKKNQNNSRRHSSKQVV